ncbi:NADH dehydrogenase [ubiquinone] 1 beta subcomplex subunit 8, mitochondrial [Procambarus clarkii]|uniref:NADH dehydrogenase [ubiquinone] 1 beta subcomplex subunit 8, mitochondrial n=1 Tax=Procambarus clarkii TaxID=6728 RepID=UPI001E6789EB|nr:NADH dehydrogenase [ubiquinone] 1 beta subcomplex subunit 8, mitochondrial-like [Procambarus clarkii]
MAAVSRAILRSRPLLGLQGLQASRAAGHWNKDWKPKPYPVTPEERAEAARKYGLRPDEYEPYPDDGLGYGDYPNLPVVAAEARDPYENWDYPEHRRNFGEPVPVDFDMYGLDRVNVTSRLRYSATQQALAFFSVMGTILAVYYYCEDKKIHWPVLPKQYPQGTAVHYTFEPLD